jgi:hypothetical protein
MREISFDELGIADHKNKSEKAVRCTVHMLLRKLFSDCVTIGTADDRTIDELEGILKEAVVESWRRGGSVPAFAWREC